MVTRLTNYTKQFWILLSTDDMDTLGSHNGDEAIVIDRDERYVFDEENRIWRQIPMSGGGGGGGGGAVYTELSAVTIVNNASPDGWHNGFYVYPNAGIAKAEISYKKLGVQATPIYICKGKLQRGGLPTPMTPFAGDGVKSDATIDSSTIVDGYTQVVVSISISDGVVWLGSWDSTGYSDTMAYKYFRLFDSSGNLLYNLIPVLDENNHACFYDTVNKDFHYNNSGHEMVAGEAVV